MRMGIMGVIEACGDIGVLSPFGARKDCCGSSYRINLDSSNIVSLAKYPFGANLTADLDVSSSTLVMGVGGGIRIYDFSTLSLISEIKTNGVVLDLQILGNYLFVANGLEGLLIYDISTPTSPNLIYHYDSPGYAKSLKISGIYLFLADGEFGVKVFDISTPSSPILVGMIPTTGDATDVDVYSGYLIVGEGTIGVEIFDISNISSPVKVSEITGIGNVRALEVSGNNLHLALGTSGVKVYDISDPTTPSLVSTASTTYNYTDTKENGYLYLAGMTGGLEIRDPSSLSLLNSVSTYGVAYKISIKGNYALVAEDIAGLEIFDISDPINPTLYGFISAEGCFYDVREYNGKIFAAAGSKGVKSFTISIPNINKINERAGGYALEVFPYNGYIFVASGTTGGLMIYDTSSLSLVGYYDTPGSAKGVFVSGNYAFVADGLYGVRIIDISDPTNPIEVSYYDSPGVAHKVFVEGNLMFVADGTMGLRIVDISDPLSPVEISYYDTPGNAMGIYVLYPYAFIADGSLSGIRVINISNPYAPFEVANYTTPGEAKDVFVRGNYIFVADGIGGLRVLDMSLLPTITEIGYYDTPWSSQSVYVNPSNIIFTADLSAGFLVLSFGHFTGIYEISIPDFVGISGGKGYINLHLTSLNPGKAKVLIYETSGRKVYGREYVVKRGSNDFTIEFNKKGVFVVKVLLPSGNVRTGTVVIR
ncbi:MAG: hypothetical protein ABIL23_05995 [candidate division WOR-3 bacterium]